MQDPSPRSDPPQEIRFCRAPDGVRIAYGVHGSGPPLVIATCWLSHLQYDWESPVWRHFLATSASSPPRPLRRARPRPVRLGRRRLRARGPDRRPRGVVDDAGSTLRPDGDVAGRAAGHRLRGRHPERVSRLMFYGSYAAACRTRRQRTRARRAVRADDQGGLGTARLGFRRVFTSLMIPGATEEQMRWLDELQRVSVSAENAYAVTPPAGDRPTSIACCRSSTCRPWCCIAAATR